MKVDRSRLKKSTSEVPVECQNLIDKLRLCSRSELLEELSQVETWTFGKCELFHWIDVLDIFDTILDEAAESVSTNRWALFCDVSFKEEDKKLLLCTLHFTTLLIEHSFSRHLYSSMEHLTVLLASSDMQVVLGVLNLLYMFSKRSNFITRLGSDKRQILLSRLHYLAESWGGKENGFGLADCCYEEKPIPASATTLHFEFYCDNSDAAAAKNGKHPINYIHLENIDKMLQSPAEIMRGLISMYNIPPEKEMLLFTHVRLAHRFSDYKSRLYCVQARLQALSVLVYSNALQDNAHMLLYPGLLEELVELLELQNPKLVDIRSAALRTLTSIIHLDRNPHFPKKPGSRLNMIIDVTGANLYHGFLPVLVRNCISTLTQFRPQQLVDEEQASTSLDLSNIVMERINASDTAVFDALISQSEKEESEFPLPLATALFSFLYHLASYEAGGDALVNCGMMESLLHVINWHGNELEHITFVTRAVRVIDLITNIDMHSFQNHGGLSSFINRLNVEVVLCKREQPFEIMVKSQVDDVITVTDSDDDIQLNVEYTNSIRNGRTCLPQRAALLKSMLNFLKKALQDPAFADSIRHVMEGSLPTSLKHIISNAEYYGPSLFLLATDVVTVYVFQEPSLLSSLQDNGLTDVVLHALLIKEVPATREVLGSLPNVFSALCLNARGLASFVKCKPFERLFKVLLSPNYLPAMRRRRSSDPLGDTASNLGNAMDELMRHQPSLKVDATAAIIKLLQELCQLGTDTRYVCQRAHTKAELTLVPVSRITGTNEAGSSDEDDEDEEESTSSHTNRDDNTQETTNTPNPSEKTPIVLVDYILNVMKFVDAILSNNSTDDHCREFVNQGGLIPLLKILSLPNLPVDCPVTAAAQAVASVCKSILSLAHEPKVLKQSLTQLAEVLQALKPLCSNINKPGGSILLHELANAPNLETAFTNPSATPLLHAMNAAHGYVLMFVHVCRTGQSDIRSLALQHWGSEEGMHVLNILADLYTSLVWESTLLLALCSDDIIPANCDFGKEDMDRLIVHDKQADTQSDSSSDLQGGGASGMTSAMQALSTDPAPVNMDIDLDAPSTSKQKDERSTPTSQQLKYIRPLLGASSRLGRALAELFGLLVKLCVGTPIRQRRGQNIVTTPPYPGPFARSVATALNCLLASGLNWEKLPTSPIPKFRLTFLICSVGFTSPMLFDEKRYPYHLMLQRFVSLGGQETFFKTFRWALSAGGKIPIEQGLEHPELPDGTGEFLDAWLMLLEKMVNPKAILDTPHIISNKGNVRGIKNCPFDPIKYLIQIHKLAFDAVKLMWGKKPLNSYGSRMSESMLSIMRHILRGEKIIKERLSKSDESMETRDQEDVNYEHLYQLLDMGFPFDQCREALMNTNSMEQATDYLLNNPPQPRDPSAAPPTAESANGNTTTVSKTAKKPKEEDCTPLSDNSIEEFIHDALSSCLRLLDILPDTVYRVCDLFVTITKRNGDVFRDHLLDVLLSEIGGNIILMLGKRDQQDPAEVLEQMLHGEPAAKMAVRIHLFTLLFEGPVFQEMRIPCAQAVHRSGILPALIKLLVECEHYMRTAGDTNTSTPKWLTPMLLLLDLVEKVALCTQRKDLMHKVTKPVWMWYDLATSKWSPYTTANQKIINDAYWGGESTVRVTCGRRRYTLTFSTMGQVNDESGNHRPISMAFLNPNSEPAKREEAPPAEEQEEMDVDDQLQEETATLPPNTTNNSGSILSSGPCPVPNIKADKRNVAVKGLTEEWTVIIVRTCVNFMKLPIDRDTLHAVMRICLRLTRDFRCARIFAQQGGVKLLLEMTQSSAFTGFVTLATLLIRHVLEEPQTLCLAIEKVIRGRALATIPPSHKEILYLFRQVSSAVCRNPDAFFEVAKNILRIDVSALHRRSNEDEDRRLLLRCDPPTRSPAQPMDEDVSVQAIHDLLLTLIKPPVVYSESPPSGSQEKVNPSLSKCAHRRASEIIRPSLDPITCDLVSDDLALINKVPKDPVSTPTKHPAADEESKKPLLPKHLILKMLAESVRSYGAVAKLITEFSFKVGQSELITEDCTALAFLLDKLLPVNDSAPDPECSMMVRMLVAAIASCNHSPDAQSVLVSEIKSALCRALVMPESSDKHSQIQLLTGLVSTMIENCPPGQSTPFRGVRLQSTTHLNPNAVNNVVKIMLRKGLLQDLARIPHFLDLSSPNMAVTINAAMKPLETLSRIVNQPANAPPKFMKKTNGRNNQSGETSTEATNAQGEETAEDAENTEHDISAAAESLEPHSEGQQQEEGDVPGLEDIMDQLLERDNQSNSRSYSDVASGRNLHAMDVDEDATEMRNLYEAERDVTEELMSTDSGDSDSNPSDQEVEDEENEDEEVDEEDMDEEGEENEENNYEENEDNNTGLGFFDNENPSIFRIAPERDEEVLMIQYSDPDPESDSVSRMVHWNPSNGFQLPFGMFEDNASNNEIAAPSSHPLLMSRHNVEMNTMSVSRTQRTNRQRRYQYLQINPRNQNPPVILQRLLGPASQNIPITGPVLAEPSLRVSNRVVVMENGFGIFPNSEEQIDFVDQSGYLFGPSLAATLNHVPSAMYWWNEECKLLDGDSEADCCVNVAHRLVPTLEQHRDAELNEKKRKRQDEDFDYKNSISKNGNESMDTENKINEVVNGTSDSSGENDSASENAQLLAESIVDSVLRPNSSPSGDMSTRNAPNTAQMLAESIVDSVLRPNEMRPRRVGGFPDDDMYRQTRDSMLNQPLFTDPDYEERLLMSATAFIDPAEYESRNDSSSTRQPVARNASDQTFSGSSNTTNRVYPQPVNFIQNGHVWEFADTLASSNTGAAASASNQQQLQSSANTQEPQAEATDGNMIRRNFPPSAARAVVSDTSRQAQLRTTEETPMFTIVNVRGNITDEDDPEDEVITIHSSSSSSEQQPEGEMQPEPRCLYSPLRRARQTNPEGSSSDQQSLFPPLRRPHHQTVAEISAEIRAHFASSQTPQLRESSARSVNLPGPQDNATESRSSRSGEIDLLAPVREREPNYESRSSRSTDMDLLVPVRERPWDPNYASSGNESRASRSSEMDLLAPTSERPYDANSTSKIQTKRDIDEMNDFRIVPVRERTADATSESSGSRSSRSTDMDLLVPGRERPYDPNYESSGTESRSSRSTDMDLLVPIRERPYDANYNSPSEHESESDTEMNDFRNEDSEIIEILNNPQRVPSPSQRRISTVQLVDDEMPANRESSNRHNRDRNAEESSESDNGTSESRDSQSDATPRVSLVVTEVPLMSISGDVFSGVSDQQTGSLATVSAPASQSSSPPPQPLHIGTSSASSSLDPGSDSADLSQPTIDPLMDIPEGVDPSFLEALPEDVRREVIAEQRRLMRLQQRAQVSTSNGEAAASGSSEVSPEFLAALPPALQEEVLAQQRLEQQRQAAATANPDDPVDAAAFFQNLQPSLRQAILTDIEESQISVLPPDLAAEAQNLRRDWEARNRQMMQERFLNQLQSNTALSSILRHGNRAGRLGARYAIHTVPQRCNWNSWTRGEVGNGSGESASTSSIKTRGRQLLDHESLSCLLVLLFADEPKLNTLRLHRVIRNLCYHAPTRDWIVRALLSIIDRSVNMKSDVEVPNVPKSSKRAYKPGPLSVKLTTDPRSQNNNAAWLNIKMDAALGCRANVFIVHRNQSGKRTDRQSASSVTVHPQAAPIVCRHALDLFISLAKSFPTFFLPLKKQKEDDKEKEDKKDGSPEYKNGKFGSTSPSKKTPTPLPEQPQTDFWDMLLKLDSLSATKKGKNITKAHNNSNTSVESDNGSTTFETSTFGQLLSILSSPVITRSPQLTDKLLRLLSLITLGLPEIPTYLPSGKNIKFKGTKVESVSAFDESLRLAINVITAKNCSEEGLEDAATLLFNVANCSDEMRYMVLWLMMQGALTLAEEVTSQIKNLLEELKSTNRLQKTSAEEAHSSDRPSKGLLCDRFTREAVVVTASSKVKQSCDLQLPSMAPLTTKTSSQAFFLRLLRLIAQIHDTVKKAAKQDIDKAKEFENIVLKDKEKASILTDPCVNADREVPNLSEMMNLGFLWNTLSQCLLELEHTPDHHAVLVLQPTVEAFFLVHSPSKSSNEPNNTETEEQPEAPEDPINQLSQATSDSAKSSASIPIDQQKFLQFAEKHRTVLNQILRQTSAHLADGPFSVLVDHTRILDFDVKRKYFRTELERLDNGIRREETAVHVRRSHVFEDSFRELYRRPPEEWKNRFYIVFEDEEGQDAGGLLREWYMIISRDIFNPMYALFTVSPGDRVTYMINSSSHCNPNHLCYYKFVGRVIAKAIYDNKLLECYFTRSFYKHILGIQVKHTDMESEDYSLYKGLKYLTENRVEDVGYELTFSAEVNEFGSTQIRDLIPNGQHVLVTEENKMEYIRLLCQMKMTGAIKQQLKAFLEGFYDIIPKRLISIFNEQELELLISGLPNVDIEDLKTNTEYHKYQNNSLQIQWFWRALRSFDQAERAKFLQFVTGTSKVPLQGFGALEGMNGTQKFQIHRDDRSTDRLPSAHTCFNQLDLPVYETYDKLRSYLLKAIHECSEGFGFA